MNGDKRVTTYFSPQKRPKILLMNFSPDDQKILVKRGYNVELGLITRPISTPEGVIWRYYFKSPPYEYDIITYNSDVSSVKRGTFPQFRDRYENEDDFGELRQAVQRGLGLSFVGSERERR